MSTLRDSTSLQEFIKQMVIVRKKFWKKERAEYVRNNMDEKVISIGMGYDISFFDKEVQKWIYEYRKENGSLRPEQIEALKAQKNLENMQQYPVIQVLNSALPEPKTNGKVSLSERKLNKYFPSHMSSREREKVILELLAKWKEEQEEMADET